MIKVAQANKRNYVTLIAVVSILINAFLAPLTFMLWIRNAELSNTIELLSQEVNNLSGQLNSIIKELNFTKQQLEYYKSQAKYYSSLIHRASGNLTFFGKTIISIVAVKAVPKGFFTVTYEGATLRCEVEIIEGEGRVLVNTSPKIGIDLQASARTAVLVAEKITETSLANADVIISIFADEPIEVVDGPSAGAAITAAIIATINGEKLNSSVYITGTINADGSIGQVGGVLEKAIAAAESGCKIFLVPPGQSMVTVAIPKEYQIAPGVKIVTYKYEQVSLEQYLLDLGYSVKVFEVSSITEAYKYFISS